MNKITFPLKPDMQGPVVADLQDALQLCLERSAIPANDAGARKSFFETLKSERARQTHGDVTDKLVSVSQIEQRLQLSGEVKKLESITNDAGLRAGILFRLMTADIVLDPRRRK